VAIGINWKEVWKPVWDPVWQQEAGPPAEEEGMPLGAGGKGRQVKTSKAQVEDDSDILEIIVASWSTLWD
jgi:hypothetical protein